MQSEKSVLLIVTHVVILFVVSKPPLFAAGHPLALTLDAILADVGANSVLLTSLPVTDVLSAIGPDKRALAFAFVVYKVTLVFLSVSPS
jgi:hypothetical protein